MAEFRYKARDATGAARSGTVDANNRSAAASQLRSRGLIVIGVDPMIQRSQKGTSFDFSKWLRPRAIDIELSLQQLAMMAKGGMPLLTSLVSLAEQAPRQSLGNIWRQIVKDIQAGDSLSGAMGKHRCFPDFVVQLVRVGERTGELPPVLERGVATMRRRRRRIQEVSSALIYPVMVVVVAICVTVYMVVYLIPRLEIYLQSLGKNMPAMTQNLVNVSGWMRQILFRCGNCGFRLVRFCPGGLPVKRRPHVAGPRFAASPVGGSTVQAV